jgi:hypothetical protein
MSDGNQSLNFRQFRDMMDAIKPLHGLIRGVYAADRSPAS